MKLTSVLVLLCACQHAPSHLITSFTASPAAVSEGQPVTLHADFHSGSIAEVLPLAAAMTSGTDLTTPAARVSGLPQETVTYTLQVTNAGKTETATATVVVTRVPGTPLISARTTVNAHETDLVASVSPEDGVAYSWTVSGGSAAILTGSTISYAASDAGTLTLNCTATNSVGGRVAAAPLAARVVGVTAIASGFTNLRGVAVDRHDAIFVTDTVASPTPNVSFVRRLTANATGYTVETIAGHDGASNCSDGVGAAAYFEDARDLTYDSRQDRLVLAEHGAIAGTSRVRYVTSNGTVATGYVQDDSDSCHPGADTVASVAQITAVAVDALDRIWALSESGTVVDLASPTDSAAAGGAGHIAFASDGALLFSPAASQPLQRATTLNGTFTFAGFIGNGFPSADGSAGQATAASFGALVTAGSASVFVDGDLIRKVSADGAVSTLLGTPALTRHTTVPLAPGELDAAIVGVAALSTGDLILITPTTVLLARLPEGAL